MSQQAMLNAVQEQYGAVARSSLSNDTAAVRSVAQAFGYSEGDLASLPPQANMGLSCGNPTALAGLRPGEVVVDLGCGGGLDVLLAAKQVEPTGRAIGIDMTPDMIERAQAGADQVGATNVEFHLAQIDALPLPDASVDCVISNCVINLVPNKAKAFREILRVLKPGGRVVISDIALQQPLPSEVAADVQAYVGCIAGAIQIAHYERMLREAGFDAVVITDTGANLNAYAQASSGGCCSSTPSDGCAATDSDKEATPLHDGLAQVLRHFDANAYAASVRVHALKPVASSSIIQNEQERTMKVIQVYDKPLCCSSGVCEPQVDPVLPRFAADLQWLKSQGVQVERFNLAQQPEAFMQNPDVHRALVTQGTTCLPLIVVDGRIVSRREYPSREMLAQWTESAATSTTERSKAVGGCCGGSPQDSVGACCAADEQANATGLVGCGCGDSGCC